MCMGKVFLRCPSCSQQVVVMRPDSGHPSWSFEKPQASEVAVDALEQIYECKNPSCHTKFTVYWYEPQKLLENV